MSKRGNENAQVSKEDYDNVMSSSKDSAALLQSFERAPASVQAQRRILSAKRPKRPAFSSEDGGDQGGGASSSLSSSSSNPFANVSFATPAPAKISFSFGASNSNGNTAPASGEAKEEKPASFNPFSNVSFGQPATKSISFGFDAGAGAGGTSKAPDQHKTVAFSFGSSSSSPAAHVPMTPAAPSVAFSFGATPAPTKGFSTAGHTPAPPGFKNSSGNVSLLVKRAQNQARKFEDILIEECREYDPKSHVMLEKLDFYFDLANCLEDEYWKRQLKETSDAPTVPATQDTAKSTAGATSFVFRNAYQDTPESTAGATPFVFGNANQDTPKSTAGAAPYVFGASSNAAAPTPGTSAGLFGSGASTFAPPKTESFSFTAAPVAPPAPASAPATATADSTDAENDAPVDANEAPSLTKGDADIDWNDLVTMEGVVHVYVGGANKAKGPLKIQQHKVSKIKRLIMRDPSVGRVFVNMALPESMCFRINPSKKNAAGIESAVCMGILTPDQVAASAITFRRAMQAESMEKIFTSAGVKKIEAKN